MSNTPRIHAPLRTRCRILIAEDHILVGKGLQCLLEPEYDIVGMIVDAGDVVATVARLFPDLLLLDLSLAIPTGLALLSDLSKEYPSVPVIALEVHAEPALAEMAIQLGARGCLPKDATIADLRSTIEGITLRNHYSWRRLQPPSTEDVVAVDDVFPTLTPRQQTIVRMIGQGLSTGEMATTLGLSPWTVHFHARTSDVDWECAAIGK